MLRNGRIALFLVLAWAPLAPAGGQDLLWTRQAGTATNDDGRGVAVDRTGNVYITGYTFGSLFGPHKGSDDIFLAKFSASGALLWARQIGTAERDASFSVAVDSAGNAYITGWTRGSLAGQSAGGYDVFLAKYDASGTLLWMRQIGTSEWDLSYAVAVDSAGSAFVAGRTTGGLGGPNAGGSDVFLAKFDSSGVRLWTRQAGSPALEIAYGVAVDGAGNAYITGIARGSLFGPHSGGDDIFIAKYDASGTLLWAHQLGTAERDESFGVAVDGAGNAYIAGSTWGSFGGASAGSDDAFLAKYDASGILLWIRHVGSFTVDHGFGVALDGAGNPHITGFTGGSFGGPNAGSFDVFLAKYDGSGTLLWVNQIGTPEWDTGYGVAVDNAGSAYVTGRTRGSLGGQNAGDRDVFLIKFGEAVCYADCDQSSGIGVLDIADFLCFQDSFVRGETYACDCDTTTGGGGGNGVCDVFDFLCFQDAFVGGCP